VQRALGEIVAELWREWRDDEVPGRAAEIAFFALLSVFPGLLALAAALSSLDVLVGQDLSGRAERATLDFLERVLTDDADRALGSVSSLFEQSSNGVLAFGVLAALWSMSRATAAVIRGLDAAYDVDERRPWAKQRLLALVLAVGTLAVLLAVAAMLVLGPLLGGGRQVADAVGAGSAFAAAWTWLRLPVAALVLTAWTAVVYHIAPSTHRGWRGEAAGAVLAASWTMVASAGFRLYLDVSPGGNEVFGVLGGGLTLLVWLYLLAIGLLLGAELNAVLASRFRDVAQSEERVAWPAGTTRT
jgi:membrane protein